MPKAFQVGASDAKIRQWIIEIEVPFLVSLTGFRGDDTSCELSILCEVRHLENRDGLDTVDGNRQPEGPCSGIGYVDRVDQESTVIFSVARDSHTAIARADDAGNQGQGICQSRWPAGGFFRLRRRYGRRTAGLLDDRICGRPLDFHAL